ncbi:hypothetical protein D3C86_1359090 [compost metagenome]
MGLRRLEAVDVEVAQPGALGDRRHRRRRRSLGPARLERHGQAGHGAEQIRPHQSAVPGDRRTPVVADDHGLILPQRPDQIDHVSDQMQDRMLLHISRFVGPAIAAHVGGDGAIARLGQGLNLRSPTDPQFGKAVQQQDQRAFARFNHLLRQAVGGDAAGLHGRSSCRAQPGPLFGLWREGRTFPFRFAAQGAMDRA